MAEDRDALLRHYRQMRQELLAAIEGVSDDRLEEASLDGWSVKDHLVHIALWDELRAEEVARVSAGQQSAWHMTDEQGDTYSDLGRTARAGWSLAQVRWELEHTHQRVLLAIASASEAGLDPSRYGEAGLLSHHEAQHTRWVRRWRGEQGL